MHTLRKSYHVGHCALEHWLLFGALLRGVALSLGMADGAASSVEDSPDDDSDFSRTCTTTGHRKRRDDDSDLGRTRTATGQKKRRVISQTAAHREERLVVERLQRFPYFITSSCYSCTLPYTSFSLLYCIHTFPLSLLCYYSSIKFINCCMIEVRGMSYALCVCLVIKYVLGQSTRHVESS